MKRIAVMLTFLAFLSIVVQQKITAWGFFGHKYINKHAIFTLPPELSAFYKANLNFIEEHAVDPDKRRYSVKSEAPRHYIDIDHYGVYPAVRDSLPTRWKAAIEKYTVDSIVAYGIVPWHVIQVTHQLTEAFEKIDYERTMRLSAELGHYVADAHVPLHTTENYNGQLTGQHGIHGFWESRLPELYIGDKSLIVGKAEYLERPDSAIWNAVWQSHALIDKVLHEEKMLTAEFPPEKKYSFERRGNQTVQVYSSEFSESYHNRLNHMVEMRMKAAIKMIGSLWYTCWINAGQPPLDPLRKEVPAEFLPADSLPTISIRPHTGHLDE